MPYYGYGGYNRRATSLYNSLISAIFSHGRINEYESIQNSEHLTLDVILSKQDYREVLNEHDYQDGTLPITLACRVAPACAVDDLIFEGADMYGKDNDGTTCFMAAAMNKSEDRAIRITKLLLKKGGASFINDHDNKGNTAIVWASKQGKLELVKLLLTVEDIDIDITNMDGESVLSLAAAHSMEMLQALLGVGIIVTYEAGASAIVHCIKKNKPDILEVLLASRDDWGDDGDEIVLMWVAKTEGGEKVVERIIKKVLEWGGGGGGAEVSVSVDAGVDATGAGADAGEVDDESRKRKREGDDVGSADDTLSKL